MDPQNMLWDGAQTAFYKDSCRAGLTVSEWCSAARSSCCALCPNPPISGPATISIWVLSTLLNLGVMLFWTNESPYNIFLVMLGTDGLMFSLLFRQFVFKEAISEFHSGFSTLIIMSCVPVICAGSLSSMRSLHGGSVTDDNREFRKKNRILDKHGRIVRKQLPVDDFVKAKYLEKSQFIPYRPTYEKWVDVVHNEKEKRLYEENEKIYNANMIPIRHRVRFPRSNSKWDRSNQGHDTLEHELVVGPDVDGTASQASATTNGTSARRESLIEVIGQFNVKSSSRTWLPYLAHWGFFAHLLFWTWTFAATFAFSHDYSQAGCTKKLGIKAFREFNAWIAFTFICIAFGFWVVFGLAFRDKYYLVRDRQVDKTYMIRFDMLMWIARLFHKDFRFIWKYKTSIRAVVGLSLYALWFACFVTEYRLSLNHFLLLGDDPWDFGQLNGMIGIFTPLIVVCRSMGENYDSSQQRETALADKGKRSREQRHSPPEEQPGDLVNQRKLLEKLSGKHPHWERQRTNTLRKIAKDPKETGESQPLFLDSLTRDHPERALLPRQNSFLQSKAYQIKHDEYAGSNASDSSEAQDPQYHFKTPTQSTINLSSHFNPSSQSLDKVGRTKSHPTLHHLPKTDAPTVPVEHKRQKTRFAQDSTSSSLGHSTSSSLPSRVYMEDVLDDTHSTNSSMPETSESDAQSALARPLLRRKKSSEKGKASSFLMSQLR